MQNELHRNNMYQSVELLLLAPMLFLLIIPKCLLIFKENNTFLPGLLFYLNGIYHLPKYCLLPWQWGIAQLTTN